ncbi:unnamed protein product [Paramecium primaurelia]|uniref:Uncharacterized protein n=1 Tax=Paramecium primaurelia TaxID=5886 RepID=A0A8S1K756_PARPR|nr:unnamed protein product [Paramecium primaurelia]
MEKFQLKHKQEQCIENLHENWILNDIQNLFREMKSEYIRTSQQKIWLEDFYSFCESEVLQKEYYTIINANFLRIII